MLYKGDKGVSDATRPPEDGPTEAGGLLASSLPLNIDGPTWMPDSTLKNLLTKHSS